MSYRVKLELAGEQIRYVANVTMPAHLTKRPEAARKFHNHLNADIAAGEWERTLTLVGVTSRAIVEDWTY